MSFFISTALIRSLHFPAFERFLRMEQQGLWEFFLSKDVNSKSIFQVIFHQCSVFYEQRGKARRKSFLLSAFSEKENENSPF